MSTAKFAIFLTLMLVKSECCTKTTFEGTKLTALKNIVLKDEVTDYNYFAKTSRSTIIPIRQIYGCITSTQEMEEAVAIQIRSEKVTIIHEGAVQNLPLLHSLHIISSEVVILKPRAFKNLPSLTIVKLQDNLIESIPANVFNHLMVRKLVLTFNRISYISPEAFDDMPRLESVKLDYNRLSVWHTEWFANCPKVELLSAKFNQLTALPPRAFRNVQESLQRLYFSENAIKEINPRAFTGLKHLSDLSLFGNNISILDDSLFLYLEKLRMIDLSHTNITCLSNGLLNSLQADVLLWIDDIPLNVTCKETLEQWATDNDNRLTFYKTLRNETIKKRF